MEGAENEARGIGSKSAMLSYKGDDKKVGIKDDTSIVRLGDVTKADLKPGARVFVNVSAMTGDEFEEGAAVVGPDGVTPSM